MRRRPRLAVLATGTEVVEPGGDPEPGQVIEFNSRVLAGLAEGWGATPVYLGRVADDRESLAAAVRDAAAAHDGVCVIAGSSAGRKDFTVEVLERCGRLLAHGVDVAPGRPVALAEVGGTPVVGVPGYPVSAIVVYRELVEPLVARMLGRAPSRPVTVGAVLRRKLPSRLGVEELVRVCLTHGDGEVVVAPLPRGAGSITTVTRAHGIVRIPATTEGYDAGTRVVVELLEDVGSPLDAVIVGGSPGPLTMLLEDAMAPAAPGTCFHHLGLADHDALAATSLGEAHVAVVAPAADVTAAAAAGAHTFRVTTSAGDVRAILVLSGTLVASALGRRLVETMTSEGYRRSLSEAFPDLGLAPRVERSTG